MRPKKYNLDYPWVISFFGILLAKVGRLGAEHNCCKQTNTQTDRHYVDLSQDVRM